MIIDAETKNYINLSTVNSMISSKLNDNLYRLEFNHTNEGASEFNISLEEYERVVKYLEKIND